MEGNRLLLVDFSQEGQKSWIRECEKLRESEKGIHLRYETESGNQDGWFLKDNINIVEEIGYMEYKNYYFSGGWVKKYY